MLDYFAVLLLIIIIFTFLKDKKILEIQKLQQDIPDLEEKIDRVLKDIKIVCFEDVENKKEIDSNGYKHLIILKNGLNLTRRDKKLLVANYINEKEKVCGFNVCLEYVNRSNIKIKDKIKNVMNRLKIIAINYMNLFSKHKLNSYGVVIGKREEIIKMLKEEISYKEIISFIPNEQISVELENVKLNKEVFWNNKIDIALILKAFLLILVGTTITTNVVYEIVMLFKTLSLNYTLMTAFALYYCYVYVLNYLYKPIGKYKLLSAYILPIYIAAYVYILISNSLKSRIKKVHAS